MTFLPYYTIFWERTYVTKFHVSKHALVSYRAIIMNTNISNLGNSYSLTIVACDLEKLSLKSEGEVL